ncbi:zinc-ribbon-containing protein [Marseillevirus Shanghai 1]|nr:zinc-ribbon-containing protein [Marseillevirus Shanghai 1]
MDKMSQQEFFVSKPWKFNCESCGKETTKKGRNFLALPFCKSCVTSTSRIASQKGRDKPRTKEEYLTEREIQHQERKEFFSLYGFELLSSSSEYRGVFSPLRVICKGGHETTVKWNNFLSEAPKEKGNCMQCLKERKRKPWDEIVAKFQEKNCEILLEQEDYTGNKQDILYVCACGEEGFVRLGNVGENWVGCIECSKKRERVPWKKVEEVIKQEGCILMTRETEYRDRYSCLKIICSCEFENNIFSTCYKEFCKGKRCSECSDSRREETCIKLYGVRNPSQNAEIQKKIQKSCYRKKEFVTPSGDVWICQGYEPFCLRDLLENEGYTEGQITTDPTKIPVIPYTYKGVDSKYFPDIYIGEENKIIEVKSERTMAIQEERNFAKIKACKEAGYDTEIRIYGENGKLLKKIFSE